MDVTTCWVYSGYTYIYIYIYMLNHPPKIHACCVPASLHIRPFAPFMQLQTLLVFLCVSSLRPKSVSSAPRLRRGIWCFAFWAVQLLRRKMSHPLIEATAQWGYENRQFFHDTRALLFTPLHMSCVEEPADFMTGLHGEEVLPMAGVPNY